MSGEVGTLGAVLADESFRHSWDMSDERKIDGAWVQGLCCDCGEFVPYGEEVDHVAAALGSTATDWLREQLGGARENVARMLPRAMVDEYGEDEKAWSELGSTRRITDAALAVVREALGVGDGSGDEGGL